MKNIIRALRAERGWSQAALADQLGVSRQSVNAIETGKYDPSLPLAFAALRPKGTKSQEGCGPFGSHPVWFICVA